jgi:hypothetical protein
VRGFLAGLGIAIVSSIWLLLTAKNNWNHAGSEFKEVAAALNRLESLAPYPNGENLRRFKAEVHEYGDVLQQLREEARNYVLPLEPLAPNEFQARLHVAITSLAEKARVGKVKLPEKFYFGFDEFAASLPSAIAAPFLGQELGQIESLFEILLEAKVEAVTAFRRISRPEEQGAVLIPASGNKPGPGQRITGKAVEQDLIETSFISTSAAARKVLNQIASNRQFFVVRLLRVRNEKEKGPGRESLTEMTTAPAVDPGSSAGPVSASESKVNAPLTFIVGNEHVEVTAKIEIVRFTF